MRVPVLEFQGIPAGSPARRLSVTFAALADPTRRAILARLASGDADVSELMKPFHLSQPTISKHLKLLERAALVARGRDAQRRPRTLIAAPLKSIDQWLESYRRFWERKFASMMPTDREVVITRDFDAPRRVVFDAGRRPSTSPSGEIRGTARLHDAGISHGCRIGRNARLPAAVSINGSVNAMKRFALRGPP
jgi:DNA-binding transcriptional ArsR family regulator